MLRTVKREQAWMVLLPAYCATKNYFQELMSNWKERGKVFYGIPKEKPGQDMTVTVTLFFSG